MANELEKSVQPVSEEIIEDLYDRLGVARTASLLLIKKAFRELSKFYHPDNSATGSKSVFEAIKEAYDILSDPERRAKYDELGLIDRQRLDDPIEVEARTQCSMILNELVNQEQNPETSPVLDKLFKIVFATRDQQFAQQRHELDNRERKINAFRKRLKRKSGKKQRSPILLMMLDNMIKQLSEGREKLKHDMEVHARVVEIFDEYNYEYTPPEMYFHQTMADFNEVQASLNGRRGNVQFNYVPGRRPPPAPDKD